MQSSQLDTASPAQDGSHSHTAETFFIQEESMTVYPRGKFAVEQPTVRVEEGQKVSAFTNKKHCIRPVEKTFRTFFENRGGDIFFNKWATIYMCYSKLQQNNLFEITQDSSTFFAPPCKPTLMLPLFARNLNLPGLKGQGESPNSFHSSEARACAPMHRPSISTSDEWKRETERDREIQTDRQSKRVGVYRRQYGVDDSWLNLSTNLSTVPRQKPGKIEILSQQLRITYAIIFQPPSRPLDLIPYTDGGAIEECDAIRLYQKQRAT